MSTTYDPKLIRRDAIRKAVRVTAENLKPGDAIVPWNNKTAARRTVRHTVVGAAGVTVTFTDGTADAYSNWTVFHRNVKI
jgi:hypothetical protein